MEIIEKQNNVAEELSARIDPHSLSYKLPGIQTWLLLVTLLVLLVILPRTALTVAQVVAIYLLLRFMVVAIFYVVSLVNIRLAHRRMRTTGPLDGLTPEQIARYPKIHHVVVIPNLKEPLTVLSRTLQALADQSISKDQLTVVLGMEETEKGACEKGKVLQEQFAGRFAHFFVTLHPEGLPGEIPGKATNQNWGVRYARRELVDRLGMCLEDLTITSCDADSVLDRDYFRELTREYLTCPRPENAIWQTPIFFDHNIWFTPASVRLLTFFNNAVQISELSSPWSMVYPLSTYSLSFKLAVDVGYWDPIVISDDWHMFLRCFFAKQGDMTVRSLFLPTIGEPFLGETTWKTWAMVYRTHIRHAWGALDMVYVLQQWNLHPRVPFFKKLGRLLKIWHDNVVFSLGGIFVAVGTGLSILLDHNPVITYPPFPVPYVMEALNFLGVAGMITIWITERIRANHQKYTWKPGTVVPEIVSWIFFAVITFVLAGLPVLHAHTKMLLGDDLAFERTPKGIVPKERTVS